MKIYKYSGEIPVRNSILVTASTIEQSETNRKGFAITRVHSISQRMNEVHMSMHYAT